VSRLLAAGLLATTGIAAWRIRKADGDARATAVPWLVAATLALSLLLSPISWKAHHVALIPAFALTVTAALRGTRWLWIPLALYVPLCGLGEELLGKGYKQTQQSLYLVTAGTLAFWFATIVGAWHRGTAAKRI
jgi:hypothetical protein